MLIIVARFLRSFYVTSLLLKSIKSPSRFSLIQRTLSQLFDLLAPAEIIKTRSEADPILAFFKHSSHRLIVFIEETHPVEANPPLINPAAVPEQRAASYR